MRQNSCGFRSIANDPNWPYCSAPTTSSSGSSNKPRIGALVCKVDSSANELACAELKTLRAAYRRFNWFWQSDQFFFFNIEIVCDREYREGSN